MPGYLTLLSLFLLNTVLAAARSALVNSSKARLRQMRDEKVRGAALAARVAEDSTPLIATLRLAQTTCRFFIAGLAALLFAPGLADVLRQSPLLAAQAYALAFAATVLLSALLVVGLGELLPEAAVLRAPERAALLFAPLPLLNLSHDDGLRAKQFADLQNIRIVSMGQLNHLFLQHFIQLGSLDHVDIQIQHERRDDACHARPGSLNAGRILKEHDRHGPIPVDRLAIDWSIPRHDGLRPSRISIVH